MKKVIFIVVLLGCFVSATARVVSEEAAKIVALNYLKGLGGQGGLLAEEGLVRLNGNNAFSGFYVFVGQGGNGFVLVSADDCAIPILGYSCESQFSFEGMPDHVAEWLMGYEIQIQGLRNLGLPSTGEVAELWQNLLNGPVQTVAFPNAVEPLLTTTWGQSPYYNDQCPYYDGVNRSVTGCVATAAAQVMKYWNWPPSGWGTHSYFGTSGLLSADFGAETYNWLQMPNLLDSTSSRAQIDAVAKLMYHIGVAVEMEYADASGATTSSYDDINTVCLENALKKYFKYKSTLASIYKDDYYDDTWCLMLKRELDAGRPIIYAGRGSAGGHCFVLDGYDVAGMFHVNWGWKGNYSGYYNVGSLNPMADVAFNSGNIALIGVEPNHSSSNTYTVAAANTNNSQWGAVSGSGSSYRSYSSTISLRATANSGYRFAQWSDGVKCNPRKMFATGDTITLTAIFEPLQGDTLNYCSNTWLYLTYRGYTHWGIRLPSTILQAGGYLKAVQIFIHTNGEYTLEVFGGSNGNCRLLHSQRLSSVQQDAWNTVELSSPLLISGTEDIWIAYQFNGSAYHACVTHNSGSTDAICCSDNGTNWVRLNVDYSWMIKGIFVSPEHVAHDTTIYCVDYEISLSENDASLGQCIGAGVFHAGSQLEVMALPKSNARFVRWSDGRTDNPRTMMLDRDIALTAIFEER